MSHPTPPNGDEPRSESVVPVEPATGSDSAAAAVEGGEEIEPKLAHTQPRIEESVRETFEAIVTAFLLAFVFRAFVVEAFVIPTGSMAPTLLGEHHRLRCEMCGYTFAVGVERDEVARFPYTPCPMCDHRIELRPGGEAGEEGSGGGTAVQSGDRILVLKYLYEFLGPRRWDVVVFKNPSKVEEFDENYIKRLIGLPGEQVWLVDGNVYTRPAMNGGGPESGHPEEGAPWEVQRKPADVQRAVWSQVYHSDYYPLDAEERGWVSPWIAEGEGWEFEHIGPRWRWRGGEEREGEGGAGELVFDFTGNRHQMRWPYNRLLGKEYDEEGPITIDEAAVSATVTPGDERCAVELWASDRKRLIRAVVERDGAARIEWRGRDEGEEGRWREAATGQTDPLVAGRPRRLEFWSVDKALWLWVDGERVVYEEEFVADLHEIAADRLEKPHPVVKVVVRGAATVRSVDLDRDLYYTQAGREYFIPRRVPDDRAALGSVNRPAVVGPDEYFVLGDNSPWSGDSRRWTTVNPWIKELTGVEVGFVPREMMLGKAFFVYFPARYTARGFEAHIVPNFGDMRFIR